MRKTNRVLLLSVPGCLSSIVAFLSAIVALVAVVALLSETRQKSTTSVTLPNLSNLTAELPFEGTFQRPVDYSDPLLAQRKILLSADLNPQTSREVVSKLLYLGRNSSAQPIDLYMQTHGGKYNDAFAIIDTMHLIKAPVNVWALGGCWSAGTVILTCATGKRYATRHAEIMVHTNLDIPAHAAALNEDAVDKERVEAIYRNHAHLPSAWFPLVGDKELYFDALTAKKYGIIDEIR